MGFKSEAQLQELLIERLNEESFLSSIKGIQQIEDHLDNNVNSRFLPGFQIDFQLRTIYCQKAREVLNSFDNYDLITGELIKNISIQKDVNDRKERLYPDILISSPELNSFSIIELKKDSQTERQAVTELFAYALELKNHLPNIADTDINLIVVSTEFSTLLDHSISSIVLGTKFNFLALKAGFDKNELTLDIHIPDSWTDIWQNSLPDYALSSVSIVPYNYEDKKSIPDEVFLFEIIDDLIMFNGAKNNSHGFFIIWKNLTSFESPSFCVSLYQINPFVFLKSSIDNGFALNTNQPLCDYIIDNYADNRYAQSESLLKIGSEVKKVLDQYYDTEYEDFSSWTDHTMQGSNFRSQALPIVFNSWGNIGDYVRYYFFHPSLRNGLFSIQQLESPRYYKDPIFGVELINRISGYTLFEDGVYNFTSLFGYAKQLRELLIVSGWLKQKKEEGKSHEFLLPRLFYATIDVLASSREVQYRVNYVKGEIATGKPLKLNPYDADKETIESINETVNWFVNDFLKGNFSHQDFFVKAINWCLLYGDRRILIEEDTENEIRQKLPEYVKEQLFSILHSEVIDKTTTYQDELFHMVKPYFNSIGELKSIDDDKDLRKVIEAIDNDFILNSFESVFIPILDRVYSEVFHPIIDFDDVSFITNDWMKLQAQLVKRFEEGHKYGAIIIDTNGNLYVGLLPKEYQILKPIENPLNEVYVFMNLSGIGLCKLVTWEQVKDGSAFKVASP